MRFSLSTESAIHGLIYLTVLGEGMPVLLPDLARKMDVSEHTLRKVFQALASAWILLALRGVNGGYLLGRSPEEITLRDIVDAVEGSYPLPQDLGDLSLRAETAQLGGVLAEELPQETVGLAGPARGPCVGQDARRDHKDGIYARFKNELSHHQEC